MNGNKLIYSIIACLVAAGVIAGVNLAIAQGKLETRATTTESVQAVHSEVIVDVPVIANEIGHIKGDIAAIKETQGKILDAIQALK
jgi:hypothetical protein